MSSQEEKTENTTEETPVNEGPDPAEKTETAEETPEEASTQNEETTKKVDPLAEKELEIARLKNELGQAKDQYMRVLAEMENFKRRKNEETKERLKYATSALAKEVITGLDNLERALTHASPGEDEGFKNFVQGIDMVQQQIAEALQRHDIKRIFPIGEKFDPNSHEAVGAIDSPKVENDCIVEVLQAGYLMHDRVIRPAIVQVCKKNKNKAQAENEPEPA